MSSRFPPKTPSTYRTVLPAGQTFEFVSAFTIFPYVITIADNVYYRQIVYLNGTKLYDNTYIVYLTGGNSGNNKGFTTNLNVGTYTVYYECGTTSLSAGGYNEVETYATYTIAAVENKLPLKQWTITGVINRILDLAEPLRQGEKPRFRLNGMRYDGTVITEENKQTGEEVGQAAKFDKILSPQLSMTKQTLRECLQDVGKIIHGEPRLKAKKGIIDYAYKTVVGRETFTNGEAFVGSGNSGIYDRTTTYGVKIGGVFYAVKLESQADPSAPANDDYYLVIQNNGTYSGTTDVYGEAEPVTGWYIEVSYDMYAGTDRSGIYVKPYILKTVSQVIESHASHLDSNAENLVNQLDKLGGVIVEPYEDGAKSVRTENQYVRITDENMIIVTQFPIYSVEKLEYVYTKDGVLSSVDITPYLFEKSVYDTQLNSYTEAYPYSKAYGLYYSQGSKNVGGLNFKVQKATSTASAFANYAIVNIIRQATGDNTLLNYGFDTDEAANAYPTMSFRITYTPFYNVRVAQTKTNYKDFPRAAALIFNQSSNVIETKYYGENLKGAIARLGNVEITKTYYLTRLSHIPKAGQLYNDDYYISAVSVEYLPNIIKCTIGLSKDFNRLSQYIGISSVKRFSEVSQTQAVERNTLWREFVVIGKQETPDEDCCIGFNMLAEIAMTFADLTFGYSPLTNVTAWGISKSGALTGSAVNLPVISSAFGNSISFSWSYADNYSAGAISTHESVAGVEGYWQNDLAYCDYYGRIYYYHFDLQPTGTEVTAENLQTLALGLPKGETKSESSGFISTVGKAPYILRKDSREILQCNFQIDFVTNDSTLIIGSALAANCPAVRGLPQSGQTAPRLYVLPEQINKFTERLEAYTDLELSELPSVAVSATINDGDGYFIVSAGNFPANGKAWAIVTAQTTTAKQVEDEDGNEVTQYETTGGAVLLAQNIEITAGQAFTPIYFTKKRDVFDKTVWKDIR